MKLKLKSILGTPLLLLSIMLSMQSCNTIKTIPMEDLELLSRSDYSELIETEQLVIKSDTALQLVYNRIATKESVPQINWDENQVILLTLGQKNTGGYSIEVDRLVHTSREIMVYYKTSGPKQGERVTQALTAPYVLFAIDNKKDLPVVFKEEND